MIQRFRYLFRFLYKKKKDFINKHLRLLCLLFILSFVSFIFTFSLQDSILPLKSSRQKTKIDFLPQDKIPSVYYKDKTLKGHHKGKSSSHTNSNSTNLSNDLSETKNSVFERFELSDNEINTFHQRRFESREMTLDISGLRINKEAFRVKSANELPKTLTIPLPEGGHQEFTHHFTDFKNQDSFVWVGQATNNKLETLFLSAHHFSFVGQLETQEARYEIKHLSKDKNIIRKVDRSHFSEDINDEIPVPVNKETIHHKASQLPLISQDTTPLTIDIVMGYSHLIKQSEGGVDATQALLNLHVSGANTAHRNSRTGVTVNVTEMIELNVSSLSHLSQNLKKLFEAEEARKRPNSYEAENPYHILIQRRHQTKSDLATLITEKAAGLNCGSAYLLHQSISSPATFKRYGLNVVGANCSMGTLAHEMGHNLGCNHSRDQYSSDSQVLQYTLPYAFGFRDPSNRFRTVMVSGCGTGGCARIFYYSDPTQTVDNTVIGQVDQVDNARSIRERAQVIANIYTNNPLNQANSLQIIQQPQGGNIKDGDSLVLQVIASGPSPLRYQWYQNQTPLTGENQANLILYSSSHKENSATYHVEIIRSDSLKKILSQPVTVNFLRRPHLLKDLNNLNVNRNDPAQLSLEATGHPTPIITWYKDGSAINNERSQTLFLEEVQWFHRGSYWATLSNSEGSISTKRIRLGLKTEDKWDFLLQSRKPSSPIESSEIGNIDRDLGITWEDKK